MSDAPAKSSVGKFVLIAAIAFAATAALFFVGASWFAPKVEKGYPVTNRAQANSDGTFQITIDASDLNRWVPLNLGAGRIATKKEPADLTFRRYIAQAPGGALDLGAVDLNQAQLVGKAHWVKDKIVDGELQNEALTGWYNYSYWTHLLRPKGRTYAVKLSSGSVAYFTFVSYYCKPEGSGCLTIRYKLANDA
jgi:hypothetical protein